MSHIVSIQTEVRDPVAVASACRRLDIPAPTLRAVQLFQSTAIGWAVLLKNWRYPVVCETPSGKLRFDNFGGRWGQPQELDRFLQAYAVEKTKLEARKQGHAVQEQALADGSIKVQIVPC